MAVGPIVDGNGLSPAAREILIAYSDDDLSRSSGTVRVLHQVSGQRNPTATLSVGADEIWNAIEPQTRASPDIVAVGPGAFSIPGSRQYGVMVQRMVRETGVLKEYFIAWLQTQGRADIGLNLHVVGSTRFDAAVLGSFTPMPGASWLGCREAINTQCSIAGINPYAFVGRSCLAAIPTTEYPVVLHLVSATPGVQQLQFNTATRVLPEDGTGDRVINTSSTIFGADTTAIALLSQNGPAFLGVGCRGQLSRAGVSSGAFFLLRVGLDSLAAACAAGAGAYRNQDPSIRVSFALSMATEPSSTPRSSLWTEAVRAGRSLREAWPSWNPDLTGGVAGNL